MAFKFVVLATLLAVANAGLIGAPAAVGYAAPAYAAPAYAASAYAAPAAYAAPSVSAIGQNTYRNFGNTQQVSTYSKALDTPFSSVRKTDVRVSNDGLAYGAAPIAHAAYAAPAYAQAAYAAPAFAAPIAKVAAPVAYAAPAAYAAPVAHAAYAAPLAHAAYAAPVAKVAGPALLGVAYSAAPAVAHMTFNGYGINYAY